MPKIDINALPVKTGSTYPAEYAARIGDRRQVRLGEASGLTQFGANLVTLGPGAMSSLRHWHEQQDEFLVVTQGVCTLIDDHGETRLYPGDCAAFPAGDANGHNIVNQTDQDAGFVVIGTHTATEAAHYSDIDMKVTARDGAVTFTRRDGTAFKD